MQTPYVIFLLPFCEFKIQFGVLVVGACVCPCMWVWLSRECWVSSVALYLDLWDSLSLNSKLAFLARLAGQQVPRLCCLHVSTRGLGGRVGGVLEAVCSQPVLTWVWIFRLKSSCLESKLSHLPRSYSLFFKGIFFRNIYFLIMWTGPYLKHKPWCVLYKYDQKFMDRDLKRNWKKLLSI